MTVLAYAPTDSYLMVMIQSMGVMGFLGPIVLVIGSKFWFAYFMWKTTGMHLISEAHLLHMTLREKNAMDFHEKVMSSI